MKVKDALLPVYDAQYGEFDVSEDRDKFIGGSDLPVICGVSKFKTRWQLLLEKAGLAEDDFEGNRYTRFGHYIEPFIRDHINLVFNTNFQPYRVVNGDIRCHTDGFNGECVLEIKSTSDISSTVDGYKTYLIQLVKYMEQCEVEKGILAVYERPEYLKSDFDASRLQVFEIRLEDHKTLLDYVNREIDRFRNDLERLKANPLMTESDLIPASADMVTLANKIVQFEKQLAAMADIEQKVKEAKKQLYQQMLKHDVKTCNLPNGTKLSRVDEIPSKSKMVKEFDVDRFRASYPGLYESFLYQKEKSIRSRAGYVRITGR